MISAKQAQAFLTDHMQSDVTKWQYAINTMLVELFQRMEGLELAATDVPLVRGAKALAGEFKQLRDILRNVAAPATASASAGPALASDGQPMSDDQAAAERLMNAAAGPHPLGNGKQRAAAPAAAVPVVGADGSPLDAAQAEAERAMIEAAGPRP